MKKEKIRKIIEEGVNFQQLCRVFLNMRKLTVTIFLSKQGKSFFSVRKRTILSSTGIPSAASGI